MLFEQKEKNIVLLRRGIASNNISAVRIRNENTMSIFLENPSNGFHTSWRIFAQAVFYFLLGQIRSTHMYSSKISNVQFYYQFFFILRLSIPFCQRNYFHSNFCLSSWMNREIVEKKGNRIFFLLQKFTQQQFKISNARTHTRLPKMMQENIFCNVSFHESSR